MHVILVEIRFCWCRQPIHDVGTPRAQHHAYGGFHYDPEYAYHGSLSLSTGFLDAPENPLREPRR